MRFPSTGVGTSGFAATDSTARRIAISRIATGNSPARRASRRRSSRCTWATVRRRARDARERLRDARSKVADEQGHQKHIASVTKRFEDALSAEESPAKQKELRDVINHNKSELEDSTNEEQQRQATEIEAEQQLRTEQDKLTMLEERLDELVRKLDNPGRAIQSR